MNLVEHHDAISLNKDTQHKCGSTYAERDNRYHTILTIPRPFNEYPVEEE